MVNSISYSLTFRFYQENASTETVISPAARVVTPLSGQAALIDNSKFAIKNGKSNNLVTLTISLLLIKTQKM